LRDLKVHLRFSRWVFGLVVLAGLVAGTAFLPFRVAAQVAASGQAAATQTDSKPEAAQSEPAQSEEEQQNNAFRLEGPVVKWTAETLHLSIDTTADLYDIFNFLIIALAVGVPLLRWMPKYLRKRKQKVRTDIDEARKMTEDANARLSAVEAKLAKIDEEIQKFRAEVEAESLRDEARIKASITEESARIVQSAELEIGNVAAQARRGLRNFAADLAIDQAAKNLVLSVETDRALIAEFVGDVLGNGNAGGGKN
jgi:F-type H+-transporting ATPase subunit b